MVKQLIKKGADLESKDGNSRTPLLLAAENGHEAVVKQLVEKVAGLDLKHNNAADAAVAGPRDRHEVVIKFPEIPHSTSAAL